MLLVCTSRIWATAHASLVLPQQGPGGSKTYDAIATEHFDEHCIKTGSEHDKKLAQF